MPSSESPSSPESGELILPPELRRRRPRNAVEAVWMKIASTAKTVWTPIQAWLDTPTTRKAVIPSYAFIGLAVWFGLGQINEVNAQRSADTQAFVVETTLNTCLTRVETRDSIRTILLAITAQFPDSESVRVIEQLIETDYPALDPVVECGLLAGESATVGS